MEKLVLRSYSYLMNSNYERISSGKPYDVALKPYSREFIEKMIAFFEESEEYEKCHVLTLFLKKELDHEKNYAIA
jgi:hypothetical protein